MSNELEALLEKAVPNSLPSLLSVCRVTVPSTQRHYVQGAENPKAQQVRERFINDVLCTFRSGRELKLDFVFGPIDTEGVDSFVPVDGQQRISTVWLLLRYAVEYIREDATRKKLLSLLERFSYAGRPYAKRFCQALTQSSCPHWAGLKKPAPPHVTLFRAGVASRGWLEDATVAAMVNMLDTIDAKWKEFDLDERAEDFLVFLWEKVVFRVCMDHFSDDLYMKMNARGLSLTQWENAKGTLAEWITDEEIRKNWESGIEKVSNMFFERFNRQGCDTQEEIHLPDDPFFALLGRFARYELHCGHFDKEIPPSLQALANAKVEDDDLPFIPWTDFSGLSNERKQEMLVLFLRILNFMLGKSGEGVENPSWVKREFLQSLFLPKNKNEMDLSLMVYAYFKNLGERITLNSSDVTASLHLFWNVLENVNESEPFDRVDQVVSIFMGRDARAGNLYLGKTVDTSDGSVQYREELAKQAFYKEGGEAISQLQSAENRLNGRVRLAILELSENRSSTMEVSKRRLDAIGRLFARWDSKRSRASVMRDVIFSEPFRLQDSVEWSIDDDNLRKMLTNRNDSILQQSLIDGRRDECEKCKFNPRGDWERDWRTNVLAFINEDIFGDDKYSAALSEKSPARIEWHNPSGVNILYVMTNCNHARPIGDWRFDLQKSGIGEHLQKLAAEGLKTISVNDGGTHSFRLANENEVINVYFYKHCIEVRWYDYYQKKQNESGWIDIPKSPINSTWVADAINAKIALMRKDRPSA